MAFVLPSVEVRLRRGRARHCHLDRLLDRQPLAVPGFEVVAFFREHHRVVRDPDPTIRHCPVRYRVWLNKET